MRFTPALIRLAAVLAGLVATACAGATEAFGGYCSQGAFFYPTATKFASFLDGTSNTYLLGELSWTGYPNRRSWVRGYYSDTRGVLLLAAKNVRYPINSNNTTTWNNDAFGSNHPGGCQFALADGSVRMVSETINMTTYLSLASRNGKEPASPE